MEEFGLVAIFRREGLILLPSLFRLPSNRFNVDKPFILVWCDSEHMQQGKNAGYLGIYPLVIFLLFT